MIRNANEIFCKPKKAIDHKALTTKWTRKNIKANLIFLLFRPFCQTKYIAIPIKVYSNNQTGPKIQLGGLKLGLTIPSYHVPIEDIVKNEPIIPANWATAIERISLKVFFKFIILFYIN